MRKAAEEDRKIQKEESTSNIGAALVGALVGAAVMGLAWAASLVQSDKSTNSSVNEENDVSGEDKLKLESVQRAHGSEPCCAVCMENRIDCLVEPCKHVNICQECAVQSKDCPVCRTPIRKRTFVFVA